MVGERPRTGGIISGWVKPPRTSLVPSTEQQSHRWGEISTQSPKDIKRQHPPRPQSLHLAAIWQKIQKCPLPYHQATGQLLLFFYLFFLLCSMEGLNSVQFLQPWHRKINGPLPRVMHCMRWVSAERQLKYLSEVAQGLRCVISENKSHAEPKQTQDPR